MVVKIEHARFETDLAVFKSSGMSHYGYIMFQVGHSELSLGLPDPKDGNTSLLQNVSNCLPVSVL